MPARDPLGYLLGSNIRPLPLHKGEGLTLGRERQNSVSLDDVLVSRQHAALEGAESGTVFLRDLESRNGTWLNHERIAPRRRMALHSGDTIRVGGKLFFFVGHEAGIEPRKQRARASKRLEDMETVKGGVTSNDVKTAVEQLKVRPEAAADQNATQHGLPPVGGGGQKPSLAGNLKDENIAQLLQFFHTTAMTGELRVYAQRLEGLTALRDGDAFFAEAGRYKGVHAIFALARQRRGHFVFKRMHKPPERPANITENTMQIIFECCKRMDEARLSGME